MKMTYQPTDEEMRKYLLPEGRDLEILGKCKELESRELSSEDKSLVEFIKTQLEKDWRKPLIEKLNELLGRH